MNTNVQSAAGATQWTDWAGATKRPADTDLDRATLATETTSTKTAAPTRPATTKLTQQDFELAMRLKAGATMNRTLDQLVDVEKIDRHGFDPVADRKKVTELDRVNTSLRNAALRYKTATPAVAEVVEAPSESTAATTAATSWAYKPLTKNEFGQQYVLNAIAAYQRNSSPSTATTQLAATMSTTIAAVTPPIAAVVAAVTTPAQTTPATSQPAATTPAPAAPSAPATSTPAQTTPAATQTTAPAQTTPAQTTPATQPAAASQPATPAQTTPAATTATPAQTTPAATTTTPAQTTPATTPATTAPAASTPKAPTPATTPVAKAPDPLTQLGTQLGVLLNTVLGVKH